jgi:hypothetical protein
VGEDQIQFWIDTMRSQELLKSQPSAASLILR